MDFYAQVDKLLKEQKMSRRQLAIKTGIPESTMSTAFMRKSLRFSELNKEKIAAALGVPWWELAGLPVEEIDGQKRVRRLDLEEKMLANYEKFHGKEAKRREALLSHYEQLNDDGQEKAVERVAELAEVPRYRKNGE